MSYILRVYFDDKIWNLDLDTFESLTIGSRKNDTIVIDALKPAQIQIEKQPDGQYQIRGRSLNRSESNGMESPVAVDVLQEWSMYRVDCEYEMGLTVHPKKDRSPRIVLLSDFDRLKIGRNRKKNNIVLANKRTSSEHCEIYRKNGKYYLRDLASTNGTYLNGELVQTEMLSDGDTICISIYRLHLSGNKLFFFNTGDDLRLNVESITAEDLPELADTGIFGEEEPELLTMTSIWEGRELPSEPEPEEIPEPIDSSEETVEQVPEMEAADVPREEPAPDWSERSEELQNAGISDTDQDPDSRIMEEPINVEIPPEIKDVPTEGTSGAELPEDLERTEDGSSEAEIQRENEDETVDGSEEAIPFEDDELTQMQLDDDFYEVTSELHSEAGSGEETQVGTDADLKRVDSDLQDPEPPADEMTEDGSREELIEALEKMSRKEVKSDDPGDLTEVGSAELEDLNDETQVGSEEDLFGETDGVTEAGDVMDPWDDEGTLDGHEEHFYTRLEDSIS